MQQMFRSCHHLQMLVLVLEDSDSEEKVKKALPKLVTDPRFFLGVYQTVNDDRVDYLAGEDIWDKAAALPVNAGRRAERCQT
jgi:hypothetical protein